jgi:hypothetical protein
MAIENANVMVELFDLTLTERKDDRFGRVVTTQSLTIDDLVKLAVANRTDLNPSTLLTSMELLKNVALTELAKGASVNFGLCHLSVGVSGVFIGDNARWDASQHELTVRAIPTADVRNTIKAAKVNVRGMASVSSVINSLIDVTTGEANSRLTPGGGANISGNKIKIEGDDAANGIYLTNVATNDEVKIPSNTILINTPSKISLVIPANLTAGDYRISIRTQHCGGSKMLKEARVATLDYILNVISVDPTLPA